MPIYACYDSLAGKIKKEKKEHITARLQRYRKTTASIYFSFVIHTVTNFTTYGKKYSTELKTG